MSERTGWAEIRAYCTCGGSFKGRSTPPDAAEYAHECWRGIHSGDGHSPCDSASASRARARARRLASVSTSAGGSTGDRVAVTSQTLSGRS